jgi:hypothetical protein
MEESPVTIKVIVERQSHNSHGGERQKCAIVQRGKYNFGSTDMEWDAPHITINNN